jgi:hypothetical protein
MKSLCLSFVIAGASILTTPAYAAVCDGLIGTRIAPVSYESAQAIFSSLSIKKDEFETTSQFEVRSAANARAAPEKLFVTTPFDPNYAKYNADKGIFEVSSPSIEQPMGMFLNWKEVFDNLTRETRVENLGSGSIVSLIGAVAVLLGSEESQIDSYEATNGFGAKFLVAKVIRTQLTIFDRENTGQGLGIFPPRGTQPGFLTWSIPVPVEQARGMKQRFRAAYQIAPKSPLYAETRLVAAGNVTAANPREVFDNSKILFADIQCAIITDDQDVVLMAYPTL